MLSRRTFFKGAAAGGAVLAFSPSILLTGCDVQDALIALLSELQTDWQAFAAASGTSIPAPVLSAFANAISAAKNWVPGTVAQSIVQALQLVSADVIPLIPILTSIQQAEAQLVLGTIINLIEYFDPKATPGPEGQKNLAVHADVVANARVAAIGGSVKGQPVNMAGIRKIKKAYEHSRKMAIGK
jgi:hypothetical protein